MTIPISEWLHTRTGRRAARATGARILISGLTTVTLVGVAVTVLVLARHGYPEVALPVLLLVPFLTGPGRDGGAK